jgi:hypothetical protein
LGGLVGYLSFKGLRPLSASIVALAVELPYVAVTDLLYLQRPVVQIVLLTLSATEVGRFSGHSRRLHGSHTTRVLGAVNGAPVSHSSFLLGVRSETLLGGFTNPSAGMVSWSDSLATRTLSDSIRLDRRLKLFSAQFISMNKFRSFLARIW